MTRYDLEQRGDTRPADGTTGNWRRDAPPWSYRPTGGGAAPSEWPFQVVDASDEDGPKVRIVPGRVNSVWLTVGGATNEPATDPKPTLAIAATCNVTMRVTLPVNGATYVPCNDVADSVDATVADPEYPPGLGYVDIPLAYVVVDGGIIMDIIPSVTKNGGLDMNVAAVPVDEALSVWTINHP